jgi:DNA transformation protein
LKRRSFNAYVLDQLRELDALELRPMFGCFGLYSDAVFFGIIWEDRLFFRTDEESRKQYVKMGVPPFQFREKQSVNSYYEVPETVLKDAGKLAAWARTAIKCQRNRRSGRPRKTRHN